MEDFFKVTIANIVTWSLIVGSWVVVWQKLRDKVDMIAETQREEKEKVAKILENGPVANQASVNNLSDRVDNYHRRIHDLEDKSVALIEIKINVEWLKRAFQIISPRQLPPAPPDLTHDI